MLRDPRARGAVRAARRAAAVALLLLAGLAACGAEPEIRHVVLVSLDTTRADHLACYGGHVDTPHLARLAAEGVVFDDVSVPAPTTLASHVSMLTGVAPRTHGVPRNGFRIPRQNVLLAERMRDAGFRTAAFLGSFALDRHFGFDRGFDEFDRDFDMLLDGADIDQNQRRAAQVTDAVLGYLDETPAGRHFLFVHYFDAHNPYDPPPPFDRLYGRPDGPTSAGLEDLARSVVEHHAALGQPPLGQSALFQRGLTAPLARAAAGEPLGADRDIAALYAGEIAYLDHHLGRLVDGLEERGILDEALVVVTADHGESFWEHGDVWNHGLWVYDTTVRVPLLLRLPGAVHAGTRVAVPVSTLDLVPTVAELVGLGPIEPCDGRSLVPAWTGGALPDAPIVAEATQPAGTVEYGVEWRNERKAKAVRDGRWKYVSAPYLELEQLFDLSVDPGEHDDLLRDPTPEALAVRDRLRTELAHWSAERTPWPARFSADANAEVVERLKSLGYLGGHDGDAAGGE